MIKLFKQIKWYGLRDWVWSLFSAVLIYIYSIFTSITIGIYKYDNTILLKLSNFYDTHPVIYGFIIIIMTSLVLWFIQIRPIIKERMNNQIDKCDITKKYEEFISDAKSLKIFGGDLSYLKDSEYQLNKILEMGDKCEILCRKSSNKMNPIYKQLLDADVDIRMYSKGKASEISNFRGQIKEDELGHKKSFHVQIKEKTGRDKIYEPINLDNEMLSDLICKKFDTIHANSKNPIIGHILMDLGGVYFDGDYYKDFLEPVNEILGTSIKHKVEHKVLLSEKLNTGEANIIQYIESEIKRSIGDEDKKTIKDMWNNIWKPNEAMISIVKEIRENGFQVYPFSNLDEENGIIYIERGDFNCFSDKRFLSFEKKLTKPKVDFFNLIKKELDVEFYELLLIDDQDANLDIAKKLGIETIKFKSAEDLRDKLYFKNIFIKN